MADTPRDQWWQLTRHSPTPAERPAGTGATVFSSFDLAQLTDEAWGLHCQRLGPAPQWLGHWDQALHTARDLRAAHGSVARLVHAVDRAELWLSLRAPSAPPARIVLTARLGSWPDYHAKWWHRASYRRGSPHYEGQVRHEGLLVDGTLGRVWESDTANVLMVKDGLWYTPDPARGPLLHGTTLRTVMARRAVVTADLTLDQLRAADQIWICNALLGLQRAQLAA